MQKAQFRHQAIELVGFNPKTLVDKIIFRLNAAPEHAFA